MMKFASKEEMEKYILKRFAEITDLIKFDDYTYIDPPDFVRNDGEVAIEITEYYRDSDKTSFKGSRRKAVESSLEKYLKNHEKNMNPKPEKN